MDKVKPRCEELGVEVRAVLVGEMKPPEELSAQITERYLALAKQAANKNLVGQYRQMQKTKATQTRSEQAQDIVDAETKVATAKIQAEQRKQVEESKLKTELQIAQNRLEAAKLQAEATVKTGQAEAYEVDQKNQAEVAGLRKKVQGFGSIEHFAQYHIVRSLTPALKEIFASDDSDFAKLFSSYMTPPAAMDRNKATKPATTIPTSASREMPSAR
jgi:hypothetical protein